MNKDVIYIEPEDDITDIIAKIEKSKEKIVALVPPKKAGVFRSVVNIKLISKAGTTAGKSVVLVTVDPSITKLAAATKLPVAKNLQSAPVIPAVETEEPAKEQTIEDVSEPEEDTTQEASGPSEDSASEADKGSSKAKKAPKEAVEAEGENEDDIDEEEDEQPLKKSKKDRKGEKKSKNKLINWIKNHKKASIFLGIFLIGVIAFLIWAFAFAPAVDIAVSIKTESKNFSEGITFTDKLSDEDAKKGKFYLEQKKIENTQEVNFEATGQKNQGSKASGELIVFAYFPINIRGSVAISAGDGFSISDLTYVANNAVSLAYSGNGKDECDNKSDAESLVDYGCKISAHVPITAIDAGSKYNIAASSTGWSTNAPVHVYSDKAMAGGSDDIKTVVQQSDIEKAKGELTTSKEEENKKKLFESIGDGYYIIETSFNQSTGSVEASPAADQEVTDGKKPVLKATTTATVYVVNKDKLKEFVEEKANLEDGQKVYDVKNMYIENFTDNGANSTAKLKAQYYIGPKITETEVVDKVKGKGLGDAQREIRDIFGVSDVKINTSYPWVMAVPGDSNKVKVTFEVSEQGSGSNSSTDNNNKSSDTKENK